MSSGRAFVVKSIRSPHSLLAQYRVAHRTSDRVEREARATKGPSERTRETGNLIQPFVDQFK